MALDPRIILGVQTPGDIEAQTLQNQLRQQQVDQNQMQLEQQQEQQGQPNLDEISKKMEIGMKLLSTVRDQASYDRAKQLAAQYGIEDLDLLPDQYDPQVVDQLGRATMTYKEQLDLQRQEQQDAFSREKFEFEKQQTGTENDMARQKLEMAQAAQAQDAQLSGAQLEMKRREQDFQNRRLGLDEQRLQREEEEAQKKANDPNYGLKPLPATALKMQREEVEAIGLSGSINADLGQFVKQIDEGKLALGPVQNVWSEGRNIAGQSSENSRNYASFKSSLEKLRNDSLRLNKGVQTEGDAQRAWNEILANINDEKLVSQRLKEVMAINKRAADLRKMNVDMIRGNYGYSPLEDDAYQQSPAVGAGDDDPITAELRRRGAL